MLNRAFFRFITIILCFNALISMVCKKNEKNPVLANFREVGQLVFF